jgi:hypothetical protein
MLCREKSAGLTDYADYADVCAKVCPKREKVNRTERTPPLAGSMPGARSYRIRQARGVGPALPLAVFGFGRLGFAFSRWR